MAVTRREFLSDGVKLAALGVVAPSFLVKAAYQRRGTGAGPGARRDAEPEHPR